MIRRLLLDSNALIWWAQGAGLSQVLRDLIESPETAAFVSVASIWELEIKRQSGKLDVAESVWDSLHRGRLGILVIDQPDAIEAARLPLHHRDPFDRMIIAQALNRGLTVVTRDKAFALYGVPILSA